MSDHVQRRGIEVDGGVCVSGNSNSSGNGKNIKQHITPTSIMIEKYMNSSNNININTNKNTPQSHSKPNTNHTTQYQQQQQQYVSLCEKDNNSYQTKLTQWKDKYQ